MLIVVPIQFTTNILVKKMSTNPITRRQNFRLVQIETHCRQHFIVHSKWKISVQLGRKHCE